jgi:quinol monooxygenase YgiN
MKIELPATVIKDQFPTINANYAPDSLKVDKSFVLGQVADDYGCLNYRLFITLRANQRLLNVEQYQ